MIRLSLKKSANIVVFDGLILLLAVVFLNPVKTSIWIGSLITLIGLVLSFWSKRFVFTRKKFSVAGPFKYVRYPYLLGHFLFVFGLIVHVRSFVFLVLTVVLLGYIYSQIIRYAEKIPYSNADTNYIEYRSSVPALIPQLLPFEITDASEVPEKIDFLSILVNDSYTELFRWLSCLMTLFASLAMIYTNEATIARIVALTIIASFYIYRVLKEYQSLKKVGN